MKKFLFSTSLLLLPVALLAQFTVSTYGHFETEITDGTTLTVTTLDEEEATVYFLIHNDNEDDIDMRIKTESFTNADGSAYQFCFGGLCIFSINENTTYPNEEAPVTIPAGGTNVQFDKFYNENPGDGVNYPMDYVFTFFQVDENDNPIGDEITFTYRFDPTLSTTGFSLGDLGINLYNTLTSDVLRIDVAESVSYNLYDLNGRLLQTETLSVGQQNISVANLRTAPYLLSFTNQNGQRATAKFVKK